VIGAVCFACVVAMVTVMLRQLSAVMSLVTDVMDVSGLQCFPLYLSSHHSDNDAKYVH